MNLILPECKQLNQNTDISQSSSPPPITPSPVPSPPPPLSHQLFLTTTSTPPPSPPLNKSPLLPLTTTTRTPLPPLPSLPPPLAYHPLECTLMLLYLMWVQIENESSTTFASWTGRTLLAINTVATQLDVPLFSLGRASTLRTKTPLVTAATLCQSLSLGMIYCPVWYAASSCLPDLTITWLSWCMHICVSGCRGGVVGCICVCVCVCVCVYVSVNV